MKKAEFERNFDIVVHDIARLIRKSVDVKVRAIGLTRSQWWVLAYLQRDEGKTQTELADILDIGKASLGALLDRLEAKGWIERRPHPTDRRAKVIYMTEAAWPVIRAVNALGREIREQNLGCLTPAERELFMDMLLRVKEAALGSYRKELRAHPGAASAKQAAPARRAASA